MAPHANDHGAAARRDSINSEQLAIRRLLRRMSADERRLSTQLRDLQTRQEHARDDIEAGGWAPPQPWAWHPADDGRPQERLAHRRELG